MNFYWKYKNLTFDNLTLLVFIRIYTGWLMTSLYSRAVVGRHHPIYFDIITYLNGDDHGEPACAQPRVWFLSEQRNQQNKWKNNKHCSWKWSFLNRGLKHSLKFTQVLYLITILKYYYLSFLFFLSLHNILEANVAFLLLLVFSILEYI